MKYLKISDLMAIKGIAEEGQISAAAIRLGSSQANLSRQLANIEEQMGLKLFHRSTRSVSLTAFGEALLLHVNHLLQAHEDTLNFIDAYKKKPFGRITVAAPSGAIVFLTRHIIPFIAKEHPDISIYFVTNQSRIDNCESDTTDMSPDWDILFSLHMPRDESLVARQVTNFSIGLFASQDYLERNPIKHPQDLSAHPCILFQVLGGSHQNTWQYRESDGKEIKSVVVTGSYICDHAQPAIELAKHGLGVLYAPLYAIVDELEMGDLVPCVPGGFNVEMPAYLIYRKRDYQPYRVHVIIDAIIKYLETSSTLLK